MCKFQFLQALFIFTYPGHEVRFTQIFQAVYKIISL